MGREGLVWQRQAHLQRVWRVGGTVMFSEALLEVPSSPSCGTGSMEGSTDGDASDEPAESAESAAIGAVEDGRAEVLSAGPGMVGSP